MFSELAQWKLCLLGITLFLVWIPRALLANSGMAWPYDGAAHYWPMNKGTGLYDAISRQTGSHQGQANSIRFVGPGKGYLFVSKGVRVTLGTYRNQCIVDPSKCRTYLTVSLWLRYTPRNKNNKQFLIGTEAGFLSPGFSIHYVPHRGSKERTIVKVTLGHAVWAGSLNVTSLEWTQIAFSWSNSTGLVLYKNCIRVSGPIKGQSIPMGPGLRRAKPSKDHSLYLSKAPGQGRGASRISYDDIGVWYSDVMGIPSNRSLICSNKVDPPELQANCKAGGRWLQVTWLPPAAQYDQLSAFELCYQGYPRSSWSCVQTLKSVNKYNITGLEPHSSVEIRVQNKLRNMYGRYSKTVVCNTTKIALDKPVNVAVTATSSSAILLKWDVPEGREVPTGFQVLYKLHGTKQKDITLDVGPHKTYLISGLQMNRRYNVRVIAYGDEHHTDSVPTEITASTAKNDLRSVLSVSIDPVGPNSLNVSWSTPKDPYATYSYQVFMQWAQGSRQKMLEIYKGSRTTCSVSMRHIPFPHTFTVMSYVESTIPPRPIKGHVANVTLQRVTWMSVTITWQPPSGFPTKYLIDVKYLVELSSGRERDRFTTKKTRLRILGLFQLTKYKLNIRAINRAGKGPWSAEQVDIMTEDRDECQSGLSGNNCSPREKDDVIFGGACSGGAYGCHRTSTCVNTIGSFYCKCGTGYIGDGVDCRELTQDYGETEFCPEEESGGCKWSRTLKGETDVTSCPPGVTGIARRTCEGVPGQAAVWAIPDLSECVSQWALDIKQQASNPNMKTTALASQLANLTSPTRGSDIYPGDLTAVVDVIGVLSSREERKDKKVKVAPQESTKFTKAVVNTASNILDSETIEKWTFIPTRKRKGQAGSLMSNLDSVALQMARSVGTGVAAMPNVVLGARSISRQNASEPVGFRENEREGKAGNMVMFPASELETKGKNGQYATYISYNSLGNLLSTNGQNSNSSINSAVLSLTLKPLKRRVFKEPVTIILSHANTDGTYGNASCVFWDKTSYPGSWSSEGCYVNSTNTTHTVCQCYHLTGFAVLMNVKGDPRAIIKGPHRLALSLITYIGIVLSVAALSIALLTFVTFRFLKSSRTFMHKNLAVSLILAQLLFLFGVNKTDIKLVCQIIAGALHYLWLASFSWMALEGVMLYLMLVKVFGTKTITNKKRVVFLTIGWGLPAIVVAIAAAIFPQGYGTEYYCWLTMERGFIWSFVGPALGVIAFNFVVMGITFGVMSKRSSLRRKPSKIRKIRYWAKACTLLTCILGLTWLFGVFYVNNETLFMAYFFTVFNSLQGVFIFLFHCVGDEKIRREYVRVLCCREKGPVYTSTSSKSSKSDSTAKMIKNTTENGDSISTGSKGLKFKDASAGFSMDGQKPVLVMFQRRPPGPRNPPLREENETDSQRSSKRMSGEIVMNPRDSLASFTSFQLQNRNSARYSLVSGNSDACDTLGRQQQAGGLSVVVELPNADAATEEATKI